MYYIKILLIVLLGTCGCFAADMDTDEPNHTDAARDNQPPTARIDAHETTLHPDSSVTDDLGPIVETIVILSDEDFFKEEKKSHGIQAKNPEQLLLLKDYPLSRNPLETHTEQSIGRFNEQHIRKTLNQLSPTKHDSTPFSIWSFLFSWIDF